MPATTNTGYALRQVKESTFTVLPLVLRGGGAPLLPRNARLAYLVPRAGFEKKSGFRAASNHCHVHQVGGQIETVLLRHPVFGVGLLAPSGQRRSLGGRLSGSGCKWRCERYPGG